MNEEGSQPESMRDWRTAHAEIMDKIFPPKRRAKRAALYKVVKVVGISFAVLCVGALWRLTAYERAVESREADAALAVSILPPGVHDAWLAYVDDQITRDITRRGNTLELFGPTTVVSTNMPYRLSCDPLLGTRIDFGEGDNSFSLQIIGGLMQEPSAFQLPLPGHRICCHQSERLPELPVDPQSVATAKLVADLCRRISDRMQAFTGMSPNR